jgi:hypothetical protein
MKEWLEISNKKKYSAIYGISSKGAMKALREVGGTYLGENIQC